MRRVLLTTEGLWSLGWQIPLPYLRGRCECRFWPAGQNQMYPPLFWFELYTFRLLDAQTFRYCESAQFQTVQACR